MENKIIINGIKVKYDFDKQKLFRKYDKKGWVEINYVLRKGALTARINYKDYQISKIIFSILMQRDISEVTPLKILHLDSDLNNLALDNIYFKEIVSSEGKSWLSVMELAKSIIKERNQTNLATVKVSIYKHLNKTPSKVMGVDRKSGSEIQLVKSIYGVKYKYSIKKAEEYVK